MEKFEYEIIRSNSTTSTTELKEQLNMLGQLGFKVEASIQRNTNQLNAVDEDIILTKQLPNNYYSFKDSGAIHNEGLNYLIHNSRMQAGTTTLEFFTKILEQSKDFCISKGVLIDPSSVAKLAEMFDIALKAPEFLFNNPSTVWNKFIGINNLTPYTSDEWKDYMIQLKTLFDSITPARPVDEICRDLVTGIDAIILEFNHDEGMSETFINAFRDTFRYPDAQLKNPGAELIGGLLYVCRGSTIYWWENYTKVGGGSTGGVGSFIQIDALGYLFGWGSALWDDAHSPGGVQESGERRRIGQGMLAAMGASGATAFGPIAAKINNAPWPSLPSDSTAFDVDENFKQYFSL